MTTATTATRRFAARDHRGRVAAFSSQRAQPRRAAPAASAAISGLHGSSGGSGAITALVVVTMLVPLGDSGQAWAQSLSPVACAVAAVCGSGSSAITSLATRGAATVTSAIINTATASTTTTIHQTTGTALLNWKSFNIGSGNSVVFKQPDASSVAINRIHDTVASQIDGALSANGQIYLINPNGLLFGSGANIDVAGLIATTLDFTRLDKGLLGDSTSKAAFENLSGAANAAIKFASGSVVKAGNVYVFAPTISNAGAISVSEGGQVVLAAGEKVFLAGSDSATLRGLLVEVGQGGAVSNTGSISTPRGNTTLVGMAVNQAGRITATSAINENGSIRLVAREVVSGAAVNPTAFTEAPAGMFLQATATGSVNVASGSTTQVLLDAKDTGTAALTDSTAAAARSTIAIDGKTISIGGSGAAGSTVLQAKGGDVIAQARSDLAQINSKHGTLGAGGGGSALTVGSDVRIDVSGEANAAVDGERNYLYIERLTSNDLRDAPLQRDGFLKGQGVYLNVAKDSAIIDVSSRRAAVAGTQAERNATGGTIALRSEGRVDVAQGAVLDVSGGSTLTSAAIGRSSQLITADGRVVDIANAKADEQYVGFADRVTTTLDAPREGLSSSTTHDAPVSTGVAEFAEGKAAGTVEINAQRGSFAATIQAHTSPTAAQRASLPAGGELRIGSITGSTDSIDKQIVYSRANVLLTGDLADAPFQVPASQQDRLLAIDVDMLKAGGVSRINVLSDGVVTVAPGAAIDVGPSGSISLQGNRVDVAASLTARGGTIVVGERPKSSDDDSLGNGRKARRLTNAADTGAVNFASGTVLDVSGMYTNDMAAAAGSTPSSAIVRNGGTISIDGRAVDVAGVARFDVDAGASVSSAGSVTGGKAGGLKILAANTEGLLGGVADAGVLTLGDAFASRISGVGFTSGGSLTIGAPRITIGSQAATGAVQLGTELFDRGFEGFTFTAGDALTVQAGTQLTPQVRQYVARRDGGLPADGADLSSAMTPQLPLPAAQRASKITLNATRNNSTVAIEAGALIDAGVGGSITAKAGQAVTVDGALVARGGSVALSLGSPALNDSNTTSVARFEKQAIQVGESARIDVSGVSRVVADAAGTRSGSVLDGGSVTMTATLGSLSVAQGAQINADGASDSVDIRHGAQLVRTAVASRGGAVSLSGQQGLFVEGDVHARSGGAGVEGGRLSVRLEGLLPSQRIQGANAAMDPAVFEALFQADRVLTISDQSQQVPASGGGFSAANYAGRGHVGTALINDAGFDTVWLASTNTVQATTSQSLATRSSLVVDAQAIKVGAGATLALQSQHIELGAQNATFDANVNGAASGGTGQLKATARDIDLVGQLALQGVGRTTLSATDAVQLRGTGTALQTTGSLKSAGDLLVTASQINPATLVDYTIDLSAKADAVLTVKASGSTPLEALSAAGSVTLKANDVVLGEGARISAPNGQITIDATNSVALARAASLSVAGTLDVPLGTVFNGTQWVYADDSNTTANNIASSSGSKLPTKGISVKAPTVDAAAGAWLDVSGGGEMVAQEFVAGPGGSIDVRQNFVPSASGATTTVRNGYFALIPARGDAAAAYDTQARTGLTADAAQGGDALLRVGQTLTLGAGSGIPAGTYTVMPARYALLPGAYAVQAVAGYADMVPGTAINEAAGTRIVAGQLGVGAGLSSTARWSGYRVLNGTQFRKLAEFREYRGSELVQAAAAVAGQVAPRTALDAAALSVSASTLRLGTANIVATPGSSTASGSAVTGRGAQVAISVPHIIVSDQPEVLPATPSDTLVLNASALSALKAETLVLGAAASRTLGSTGANTLALDVGAQSVSLGGTQALSAGELLLVARDDVSVKTGAEMQADESQAKSTTTAITSQGDGAAVLLSNAATLPTWARSGATGARGDLNIAQSAVLRGRSVLLDASHAQNYAPSAAFNARNIGLSAFSVNLGEVTADAVGLSLSNALLAQLADADSLAISSGSAFNLYGNAQVGGAKLGALTLDGAGFVAQGSNTAAVARITAGDITVRNSAGVAVPVSTSTTSAALNITALGATTATPAATGNVTLAGGALAVRGFAATTVTATGAALSSAATPADQGQILLAGTGSLVVDGALTLDAARISAGRLAGQAAADQSVSSTGVLRTQASSAAIAPVPNELGAKLGLSGERIEHAGRIELPSGELTLAATGTANTDHVTLATGSRTSVAGSTQTFGDQTADASAGTLTLSSAAGSVRALQGSTLDIAGAGSNGDAGTLRVSATQGTLQLDGTLRAQAGSAALGATVAVDVGSLPDLGTVARPLMVATGGVAAQSVDVRVRQGDVTLAAADTLAARSITVSADGGAHASRARDGAVNILGTLDASGERAGRVAVYARDAINLGASSRINARSSGAGEEGGSVLLSARINEAAQVPTTLDAISIAQGAQVDVSGPAGSSTADLGGTVTLRAPRVGNDVAIAALPQYLTGARQEIVEATVVKAYTGNLSLNASTAASATNPLPTLRTELKTYMSDANRAAMAARLGQGGAASSHLRPGLEVRSTGTITVAASTDFAAGLNADGSTGNFSWRYGGTTLAGSEPGALTLRSAGNLTLVGGLSDGFRTVSKVDVNGVTTNVNSNATLTPFAEGDSWRYQLTAGADLTGAAAASTNAASTANLALNRTSSTSDSAVIRTGTGRIDIASAGSIQLNAKDTAIYTGGTLVQDAPVFENAAVKALNPAFTEHGGGISLVAGLDITAVASTQLINNWLWRVGKADASGNFSGVANAPTSWWVNAGSFKQGVGALGGGDLTVRAGRDIKSLTAVVPSNGTLQLTASGQAGSVLERNGGALDVRADGAISAGVYYAQRGELNVKAGSIGALGQDPVFVAQGDNVARLQARKDLAIFGSFNPTWATAPGLFDNLTAAKTPTSTAFSTYGDDSALDLRSAAGTLTLGGNFVLTRLPTGSASSTDLSGNSRNLFQVLPGTVDAVAFGGDVRVPQSRLLAPSDTGQLRLLADGSVNGSGGRLVMAAADPSELASVAAPQDNTTWRNAFPTLLYGGILQADGTLARSSTWGLNRPENHSGTVLHAGDTTPAVVVARSGNVTELTLEVPKSVSISAGGDVTDLALWAQNVGADDVTRVHAGGAITVSTGVSAAGITVTGPGAVEVLAGGAIDLGSSTAGVLTQGNLTNSHLPDGGAHIIVAAGLGRGADGFVLAPDYANVLSQFVQFDAFAAAGADAAVLNAQALAGAHFGSDAAEARAQLSAALAHRGTAAQAGSAFQTWLSTQTPAARMRYALALAQSVQAVSNARFVATANTETFAPGYLALADLFPSLAADTAGLAQFVSASPFTGASNAAALQGEAVAGLPEPLRSALLLGLDNPTQAATSGSAFKQALATIDTATLRSGSRALQAAVQTLAGRELTALRAAGRVGSTVGTPFARGLDALAQAFSPAGAVGSNDITLVFSQIKAEQSGNLYLLAPRGGVVAGQANPPAGSVNKQAYELGVLTFGGGDIAALVRDNFDVYRSRVFTVAGGDIHLWSSLGNIDAGRGPRDTAVAPPPRLVIDEATGIVTLDVSSSVSGSGIGALKTRDDQPTSDIRLIAPAGFIDAGEAGIRADAGTVTLGTNIVLNAGNINAGGGVSGGAVVVSAPAPVPTATSAGQADKASEKAQQALAAQEKESEERAKKERRKRVVGEFIGFGEGTN